MKSLGVSFAPFVLSMVFMACHNPHSDNVKEIHSLVAREAIQPAWHSSHWESGSTININGDKAGSENQMFVFSSWDNDSLYFYFKVHDSDLRAYQTEKDHPQLFLDDMVEVLIDARNDKDSCWAADDIVYHINLLGKKKDDRGSLECLTEPTWDGDARISIQLFGTLNDTTDIDSGFLMALVVPWSEIGQKPQLGFRIGINFANGDNDGKGRQLFDWAGAWPMRSPYAFGDLILRREEN